MLVFFSITNLVSSLLKEAVYWRSFSPRAEVIRFYFCFKFFFGVSALPGLNPSSACHAERGTHYLPHSRSLSKSPK